MIAPPNALHVKMYYVNTRLEKNDKPSKFFNYRNISKQKFAVAVAELFFGLKKKR